MRARWVALAVALALTLDALATGCAPSRRVRTPGPHLPLGENPVGYPFKGDYLTYPSGMRAVVYQAAGAPSTWVTLSYSLAGLTEPEGKAGLTSLAQALSARGGMVRGGLRADERIFALGALSASTTDPDQITFRSRVRSTSLPDLLGIEAARLRDAASGLDDEEIVRARERLARALEDERDAEPALEVLVRRALAGTPYGRPAPTASTVRAIEPEDVRAFLRAAVRPERAVVVVVGPTGTDRSLRLVSNAFGEGGRVTVKPVTPPRIDPPAAATPEPAHIPGRGDHRELWLGWSIPGHGGRATIGARMASEELVRTLRARVARADLRGSVEGIEGAELLYEGAGLLHVRVVLSDGADVDGVRTRLVETATALGTSFEDDASLRLERKRREVTYGMFRLIEHGLVEGVPELVRALDEPSAVTEWTRQVNEAHHAVPALLRAHVRKERTVALVVEKAAAPEPRDEPAEEVHAWGRATHVLSMAAPGAGDVRALLSQPFPAGAVRRKLANGLDVVVLPRGSFPTVQVSLFVRGDSETPLARARKRAALHAIELESRYRLSGHHSVPGGFEFTEGGPSAWLPYYLANVGCWTWTRPSTSKIREVIAATRRDEAKGRTGGSEGGIYGAVQGALVSTAEAPVSPGTPMARVEAGEAARELSGWFRPDRATLVIVGQVTPSEALWNDVQDAVGSWEAEGPPLDERAAPAGPTRRRVILFDHPGASRAQVTVIVRTPPRGARDDGAHAVLSSHLGELGAQLLTPAGMAARLGGADGLWLSSIRLSFGGQPRQATSAVRAVLAELDRLAVTPISPIDLDFARWGTARWEAFAYDDLSSVVARLGEAALRGVPVERLALAEPLAAATPATVHAYARQVLGRELVAISGDAALLEPELRRVGIQPEIVRAPKR